MRIRIRPLVSACVVFLLYVAATAIAADTPPPPAFDTATWLKDLYVAVTSKNWGLVVGLGLIAIVYPLRLWGPAVVKGKLGGLLLGFFTSLAGTFGIAIAATGKWPDLALIVTALTTAATAAGLWEWIKTHIPGMPVVAAKATVVEPPDARVVLD